MKKRFTLTDSFIHVFLLCDEACLSCAGDDRVSDIPNAGPGGGGGADHAHPGKADPPLHAGTRAG